MTLPDCIVCSLGFSPMGMCRDIKSRNSARATGNRDKPKETLHIDKPAQECACSFLLALTNGAMSQESARGVETFQNEGEETHTTHLLPNPFSSKNSWRAQNLHAHSVLKRLACPKLFPTLAGMAGKTVRQYALGAGARVTDNVGSVKTRA